MKDLLHIKCPECKGIGKIRDWFATITTLGFLSLVGDDFDECEKCKGVGVLLIRVLDEGKIMVGSE